MRAAGATAVVCDAFDAAGLEAAVKDAAPEVVINQLTSLPERYEPRKASFYAATDRVRREGGRNLLAAARAAGARRFLAESICFLYAPGGGWVKDEEAPTFDDAPGNFGGAVEAMVGHEREALGADGIEALVLRYGQFYGPGTYYAPRRPPQAGSSKAALPGRRRRHRDLLLRRGRRRRRRDRGRARRRRRRASTTSVDDEPSPLHEWLPVYAEALGAKPPRRVPVWLARLAAGRAVAEQAIEMRGASNAKAKRELGWQPAHPSWRRGFFEALA